jgi:hypothetical protein
MIIFGTAFVADVIGGSGSAFGEVVFMLRTPELKIIFTVITAVIAYIIGIINIAGSEMVFSSLVKTTEDDLLLISRIESLQQPELLKEILDLLNVKRTLVGFIFPLFYFGIALVCDPKQWPSSHVVPIVTGILLALAAGLAAVLAVLMTRHLDRTAKKLLAGRKADDCRVGPTQGIDSAIKIAE